MTEWLSDWQMTAWLDDTTDFHALIYDQTAFSYLLSGLLTD